MDYSWHEEVNAEHIENQKVVANARAVIRESEYAMRKDIKKDEATKTLMMDINKLLDNYFEDNKEQEGRNKPIIKNIEKVSYPLERLGRVRGSTSTWTEIAAGPSQSRAPEKRKRINQVPAKGERKSYKDNSKERERYARNLDHLNNLLKKNNKTAAITINCREEEKYTEIMLKAKRDISLKEIGIEDCRVRKGFTRGLIIEIPGDNADSKADQLVEKLKVVLSQYEVRINRPIKKVDIKLTGLELTTSKEEITEAIVNLGNTSLEEVKVSDIRLDNRDLRTAWIQCSIKAAIKLMEKRKVEVGWTTVICELMENKPLRCYRCLETGHSKANCRNTIDRSGTCFNCGARGHVASACSNPPNCLVCRHYGKQANHRVGGYKCVPSTIDERSNTRNRRPENKIGRPISNNENNTV